MIGDDSRATERTGSMATVTKLTVDDLDEMDLGDGRYELIDGELVERTPAGWDHGRIGAEAIIRLGTYARRHNLGKVVNADTGFALTPYRVRCADVAFVSAARVVELSEPTKIARFAPDLVVEIASPTDRPGAINKKIAEWLAAGVHRAWLFHPESRSITVHVPGQPSQTLGPDRYLTGCDVLPGFRVRVADFFA
jgi:Uma2 family endonuclease